MQSRCQYRKNKSRIKTRGYRRHVQRLCPSVRLAEQKCFNYYTLPSFVPQSGIPFAVIRRELKGGRFWSYSFMTAAMQSMMLRAYKMSAP